MYGEFDQFYCRAFKPLLDLRAAFRASDDRFRRYLAESAEVFQYTYLVKPADGFTSPEHEQFFIRSWDLNSRLRVVAGFLGVIGQQGHVLGPVWTAPHEAAPGRKQPIAHWRNPDAARNGFENWWLTGAGESRLLYAGRAQVANLDREYDWLTDEARLAFRLAHPGYSPPGGGIKAGHGKDATIGNY